MRVEGFGRAHRSLHGASNAVTAEAAFPLLPSQRVALAAAKQSLRPHGMAVRKPMRLEELLSEVAAAPVALVATAQGGPILPALRSCADLLEAARR